VKDHKPITFAVIILGLVGFAASSIRALVAFETQKYMKVLTPGVNVS
jgi:hypothetical protein